MEEKYEPASSGHRKVDGGHRYDLEERLLAYSAGIIAIVDNMRDSTGARHVGTQLIRSGTSPLPNHGEAGAAESRRDFIHKMKICLKELRESRRWLRLILKANLARSQENVPPLIQETEALIKIFFTSVRTAQRNAEGAGDLRPGSYRLREDFPLEVEC